MKTCTHTRWNQGTGMSASRHPTTRRPNSLRTQDFSSLRTGIYSFLWCSFVCDLTGLFLFLLNTIGHAQYSKVLSTSPELAKGTGPSDFGNETLPKKKKRKRAEASGEWGEPKRNANKLFWFLGFLSSKAFSCQHLKDGMGTQIENTGRGVL